MSADHRAALEYAEHLLYPRTIPGVPKCENNLAAAYIEALEALRPLAGPESAITLADK